MSVPGIVEAALGDEQVAAQVSLGSEDELYVTPSRILIYRGEGLLSDESVEEYAHRAERVVVGQGRRKASITLEHDLEGERSFSVPPDRLDDVLHPVLAGVLSAAGVTDPGETVKHTYRFSELTLIITNRRLVKHIGTAVWDTDYEEFRFEDTTDLAFEEGSVATQIVMEVEGRRERIKAPNEQAPQVRAHLEEALLEYHESASIEAFRDEVGDADGTGGRDAAEGEGDADGMTFESGLSPLGGEDDGEPSDVDPESSFAPAESTGSTGADAAGDAGPVPGGDAGAGGAGGAESTASGADLGAGGDPAVSEASVEPDRDELTDEELARRLDDIASAVNKQNELLKRHQETMEKLVDELQRMQ